MAAAESTESVRPVKSDEPVTAVTPEETAFSTAFSTRPTFSPTATDDVIRCNDCRNSDRSHDPEYDLNMPLHGWPQVAHLMATHPEYASFQRFRDLNVKNLLYYQAELDDLRRRLHKTEWRDHTRGDFRDASALNSNIAILVRSGESDEMRGSRQWLIVQNIRHVLKEYSELMCKLCFYLTLTLYIDQALLQFSQISALPDPESFNTRTLKRWLLDAAWRNIRGPGSASWGDVSQEDERKPDSLLFQIIGLFGSLIFLQRDSKEHKYDLVITDPLGSKIDPFTNWLFSRVLPVWERLRDLWKHDGKKHDEEAPPSSKRLPRSNTEAQDKRNLFNKIQNLWKGEKSEKSNRRRSIFSVREADPIERDLEAQKRFKPPPLISSLAKWISSFSTLLTCLLPAIAITVLAQLEHLKDLLLCLIGFTALFAMAIPYLSTEKRSNMDIFQASAM